MRLEWLRPKSELTDVLVQPRADGPEIAYWIFSDLSKDKWKDMTIITPGLYGKEFPKTYGHYHTPRVLETYKLISGDGIFIFQKKYIENGRWLPDRVSEIYFVKLAPKEEITVPFDFGHCWINIGDTPLITYDDWQSGHVNTDYEPIKKLRGMCFYVLYENGAIKFVENKNYKNHPTPRIVTAKEFQKLYPVN